MKSILITQRFIENNSYAEMREALDSNWGKFFNEVNAIPIPCLSEFDIEKYLNLTDIGGVLLSGGNDLSIFSLDKASLLRDKFENNLIKKCIEHDIPLLGICRGMQIIASYFGVPLKKKEGHIGTYHELTFIKDSTYYNCFSKKREVNSFHNYAILETTNGLMEFAVSEDGSIEGIYHQKYNIAGIMWHPEREYPFNKTDISFINQFFKL